MWLRSRAHIPPGWIGFSRPKAWQTDARCWVCWKRSRSDRFRFRSTKGLAENAKNQKEARFAPERERSEIYRDTMMPVPFGQHIQVHLNTQMERLPHLRSYHYTKSTNEVSHRGLSVASRCQLFFCRQLWWLSQRFHTFTL